MTYNGLEEDSCECSRDYRNILGKISVYSEFSFYTKNIDDFSTVYGNSLYPSLTKDSDNLFLNLAESGHFFFGLTIVDR